MQVYIINTSSIPGKFGSSLSIMDDSGTSSSVLKRGRPVIVMHFNACVHSIQVLITHQGGLDLSPKNNSYDLRKIKSIKYSKDYIRLRMKASL